MGILERLGLVRYETTARVHGTTTYKNDPVTYVDAFITGGFWQHDDVLHQAQMMRLNPYAHAVTTGIANSVFEDDFYFVDPEDDEKKVMQDVKDRLNEMEANKWFALALAGERGHGWTWLYVGTEELQTDTTIERARVLKLDTFTPEYAKVSEWDEEGKPKTLKLKVMVGGGGGSYIEKDIDVSDCILIRNRPYDRTHKGLSITGPIWRALVGTALIGHAVTTYSAKMGMGAPVITTKGAIGTERAAAAEAALEDWSPTRAFVIPNTVVEKFEFIGASGSTVDFGKYHDIFLDEIATGTKIPRSELTGGAEVAAGADVGPDNLAKIIQGEQTRFEVYIREVVRKMNGDSQNYKIYWPVKVAVDEKQEAEIRMMNAQADMMEQQAKMASEGRGPNDSTITVEGKAKDPDKVQNRAGSQTK
ncbi:MAG: phage portal protein family protein [Planctomycetota bacterium]|jgi:hypothetical protein